MRDLRHLLGDPRQIAELSAEEAASTLVELSTLQAALAARLRSAPVVQAAGEDALAADRLLTAEDVAQHFGRSVAWVYRQANHWSFTRRVTRRTVRFSQAGLHRFLAQRRTFAP